MLNRSRSNPEGLPSRRNRNRTVAGLSWSDRIQREIENGSNWFGPEDFHPSRSYGRQVSGKRPVKRPQLPRRRPKTAGQFYMQKEQQGSSVGQYYRQRQEPKTRRAVRGYPSPKRSRYQRTVGAPPNMDIESYLAQIENMILSSPELAPIFQPIDDPRRYDPHSINMLDRETNEKLEITYLATSRDGEFVVVVSLFAQEGGYEEYERQGIALTTDVNPTPEEVVDLVIDVVAMADEAAAEYQPVMPEYAMPMQVSGVRPSTVGGNKPKDAASIAGQLVSLLVSSLTNENLYKFHSLEENKVNLWYDNQEITMVFTITPENRLKINLSGANGDDVIIRDMNYYDPQTLVDEILIKLRGYSYGGSETTNGSPKPVIHPSLTIGAPELSPETVMLTEAPTTLYMQPKALELIMLEATKIKDEDDMIRYCNEVLAMPEKGKYIVVDTKGKLKTKAYSSRTKDIVPIQSDLVRWICEWARDYADDKKMIKAVAEASIKLVQDPEQGSPILGIGDFPALVRIASQPKKKASRKRTKAKATKAKAKKATRKKKKAKSKKKKPR